MLRTSHISATEEERKPLLRKTSEEKSNYIARFFSCLASPFVEIYRYVFSSSSSKAKSSNYRCEITKVEGEITTKKLFKKIKNTDQYELVKEYQSSKCKNKHTNTSAKTIGDIFIHSMLYRKFSYNYFYRHTQSTHHSNNTSAGTAKTASDVNRCIGFTEKIKH